LSNQLRRQAKIPNPLKQPITPKVLGIEKSCGILDLHLKPQSFPAVLKPELWIQTQTASNPYIKDVLFDFFKFGLWVEK